VTGPRRSPSALREGFYDRTVFERFTDRARRVVVLAQDEARVLNHNYIGTEHLLLGLIREGEGVAARALESLGVSLEVARREIEEIIGSGGQSPSGHIPFTPRAKKVLELSLREAQQLGHNYLGTEHILLGLIREGEGVAAQVLEKLGADLARVRREVVHILSGQGGAPESVGEMAIAPAEGASLLLPMRERPVQPVCSFCGRDLWEAAHYVRGEAGAICDECTNVAHAAVDAAPDDRHALFLPARIYGTAPGDRSVDEIIGAVRQTFATIDPREMVASVEGGPDVLETAERVLARRPSALPPFEVRIERIRFLDDTIAAVRIAHGTGEVTANSYEIRAVLVGDRWLISRDTFLFVISAVSRYPT
jgi:hypothetical protein